MVLIRFIEISLVNLLNSLSLFMNSIFDNLGPFRGLAIGFVSELCRLTDKSCKVFRKLETVTIDCYN